MIVRAAQIRSLNENYGAQGNSIVLLYGRDGCEKEGMLRVYLQDKKHLYTDAIIIASLPDQVNKT